MSLWTFLFWQSQLKVIWIYSSSFLLHCSSISAAFCDIMLLIFACLGVFSGARLYLWKMYDGQNMKIRTKTNSVSRFIYKIWKSNWHIKIEQNFGNFIFRNSFGDVPEMGQHSTPERICGKTFFDGNCISTLGADCNTGEPPAQMVKRLSLIFQNACQLPLLPQLHLFHDGLDLLNIALLFFSRTPSFLQRPGRLVTHQLQHQRPFLPQRSQTCLCVEEVQNHRVKITRYNLFLNIGFSGVTVYNWLTEVRLEQSQTCAVPHVPHMLLW